MCANFGSGRRKKPPATARVDDDPKLFGLIFSETKLSDILKASETMCSKQRVFCFFACLFVSVCLSFLFPCISIVVAFLSSQETHRSFLFLVDDDSLGTDRQPTDRLIDRSIDRLSDE